MVHRLSGRILTDEDSNLHRWEFTHRRLRALRRKPLIRQNTATSTGMDCRLRCTPPMKGGDEREEEEPKRKDRPVRFADGREEASDDDG